MNFVKPVTKVNAYVFAITTSLVYYLWDSLSLVLTKEPIGSYIIIFIFSVGFYKGIYKTILFVCNHVQFFRKLVLGKNFFEGTWVGYYKYKDEIHFSYEIYYQSIEELYIYGRSFDSNGKSISNWSIVEPYVNIQKSQFSYFYEINDSSISDFYMGYASSTIIYYKHNKPCIFDGFAVDGDDSSKQFFISVKESDSSNKYVNNQKYLLEKAYELYKNENLF